MTIYCEELANKICARIAAGEQLIKICAEDEMPTRQTVAAWTMKHEEFMHKMTSALQQRAESYAESIVAEAESVAPDMGSIQKAKLIIDTKKWIMGKLLKQYADKVTLAGDKDNPLTLNIAAMLDAGIAARDAARRVEHLKTIDGTFEKVVENQGPGGGVCAPIGSDAG